MILERFRPDFFEGTAEIDYVYLNGMFKHTLHFASKGRHSIRHIIASSGKNGVALMPVYACSSIPEAVRKSGNEVIYCDIDERDLNLSIESVKKIVENRKITFLIAPSLYGNPANLEMLECICKENNIFLIDDAAQSFGAKLNERYVGTFGNAGFFAFSPGKPLTSSMGSFFWTDNTDYRIDYQYNHWLLHQVAFWDFYYNRYKIYDRTKFSPYKILTYMNILLQKKIDIVNDGMMKFEADIIGRLIEEFEKGSLNYRQAYTDKLKKAINENSRFRVISNIRGESNSQKLVLVFENKDDANNSRASLFKQGIYTSGGYQLLSDTPEYPIAYGLKQRIVEIPIENDEKKMEWLADTINKL